MQIAGVTIHNFRSVADSTFALGEYSLLIGANNSGKSNVMDALRIFYEKNLKYEEARDFPKFSTEDKESWIDIEYELSDDEYSNLKEDYCQTNNRVKVRKYFQTRKKGADGKTKQGIYAYIEDEISDQLFYGAKNVQQGKLGDVIYIPAVSRLDDHTKMTGPSVLRDLINDILKKLVKTSEAFSSLTEDFESFTTNLKVEETDDKKSITRLEQDINEDIDEWGAAFEIDIKPVTASDILKNLVSFKIIDEALNQRLDASQFGQGFQRHLIFTLIRLAAKYQEPSLLGGKKEFAPDMTALLFEEPEAFLHPMQQNLLCRSLQLIAAEEYHQVLISSHSPNFVSQNTNDLPSIIRLCRHDNESITGQITYEQLTGLFSENQQINNILNDTRYAADADDLKEDMEAVKYFLWLDTERCGMFFAGHVLLVEGPTERALFNFLIESGKISMPKGGVFILDCIGKFNIHRFMNILGPLNIHHSVMFDADNENPPHDLIKQFIESCKNAYTCKIDAFSTDIETYLGVEKTKTHRKPQHMMLKLQENEIPEEKIDGLCERINSLWL